MTKSKVLSHHGWRFGSHFPIQMCADTYEELLWHWSFTVPVVAVVTLTTATEVMQSLEDRRLAHVGLTMVAIIIFFWQC